MIVFSTSHITFTAVVFPCLIPCCNNEKMVINIKYGWNFSWPVICWTFLTTSKANTGGPQQGQMHSFVKLSPDKQSCNLSQLYHHEMFLKYSTIYILQLLQVSSEHHVTSIPITLAETIYNILYKIWEPI
jgi:hypothetical protein